MCWKYLICTSNKSKETRCGRRSLSKSKHLFSITMIKKISELKAVSLSYQRECKKLLRKSETEIGIIRLRNKPSTSSFPGNLIYGSGALSMTESSSFNTTHISTGDGNTVHVCAFMLFYQAHPLTAAELSSKCAETSVNTWLILIILRCEHPSSEKANSQEKSEYCLIINKNGNFPSPQSRQAGSCSHNVNIQHWEEWLKWP